MIWELLSDIGLSIYRRMIQEAHISNLYLHAEILADMCKDVLHADQHSGYNGPEHKRLGLASQQTSCQSMLQLDTENQPGVVDWTSDYKQTEGYFDMDLRKLCTCIGNQDAISCSCGTGW